MVRMATETDREAGEGDGGGREAVDSGEVVVVRDIETCSALSISSRANFGTVHDGARRQYARVHIYGSNLSLRLPPYYLLGPAVSHTHCITVVQCFSLRGKTPVDGREGEEMFYTRRRGGFVWNYDTTGFWCTIGI